SPPASTASALAASASQIVLHIARGPRSHLPRTGAGAAAPRGGIFAGAGTAGDRVARGRFVLDTSKCGTPEARFLSAIAFDRRWRDPSSFPFPLPWLAEPFATYREKSHPMPGSRGEPGVGWLERTSGAALTLPPGRARSAGPAPARPPERPPRKLQLVDAD